MLGLLPNLPDRVEKSDARQVVAIHSTRILGDETILGHKDIYLGSKIKKILGSPLDSLSNIFAGAGEHQDAYHFWNLILQSREESGILDSPEQVLTGV